MDRSSLNRLMVILEACIESLDGYKNAQHAQVQRIELNSALHLGGLTPSAGLVKNVLAKEPAIPVIAMVRPRGGGFNYTDNEYETMLQDGEWLLKAGVAGLAFGFLDENHEVDQVRTKAFVELCHQYRREAVFHRAIDISKDYLASIAILVDCSVDRILTSGYADKALQGIDTLKQAHQRFGQDIEFCVASGVAANNIADLVDRTGINQVHGSFKQWHQDADTSLGQVSFKYSDLGSYEETSLSGLIEAMEVIKSL